MPDQTTITRAAGRGPSLLDVIAAADSPREALGRYAALRAMGRAIAAGELTFAEAYDMAVREIGMPAAAWYASAAPRRFMLADVCTIGGAR